MRVRFLLYSVKNMQNINRRFLWIGKNISKMFYSLKYHLVNAGIDVEPEKYLTASFFSALTYGVIFFFLFYFLFFLRDQAMLMDNILISQGFGLIFFVLFFLLHLVYPKIMAKKVASSIDNTLVFALKAMLVQVSSGVSLFEAMKNISKSKYGIVSLEFKKVVSDISTGESEPKALEKMALHTQSKHLRKTAWQLLNSIRSGSSIQGSLKAIVLDLTRAQERAIKDYTAELNMWILIYLLLAAAIPALGITFLIILSAMGGAAIGPTHIIFIAIIAFVVQISLIGFVKNRVPKVFMQ